MKRDFHFDDVWGKEDGGGGGEADTLLKDPAPFLFPDQGIAIDQEHRKHELKQTACCVPIVVLISIY